MNAFLFTVVFGFLKLDFMCCKSETLEQMLTKAESLSLHDLKDLATHQEHPYNSHVHFQAWVLILLNIIYGQIGLILGPIHKIDQCLTFNSSQRKIS